MQIATGYLNSGARHADGTLEWWGLVPSSDAAEAAILPTAIAGIAGAIDFGLGRSHGCARFSGGPIKCWGRNTVGQLGNGSTTSSFPPTIATTSSGLASTSLATAVVVGYNTSFALDSGGDVLGWPLQRLSIAPLASWSGLPVAIAMGTSDALFQVQLTAYLPAERSYAVAKFAAQLPDARLALALQTELHALMGSASYERRCGRTPSSTFTLKRPPSAEEQAKFLAVDDEPLGLEARMKKQNAILQVYADRWNAAAARALRAHGFHADAKSETWTSGTTVAFFGFSSVTLVFGGVVAPGGG